MNFKVLERKLEGASTILLGIILFTILIGNKDFVKEMIWFIKSLPMAWQYGLYALSIFLIWIGLK